MMTESERLDQALTEADARQWRYKAEQAEAALAQCRDELFDMMAQRDMAEEMHTGAKVAYASATKIIDKLIYQRGEALSRAEAAEAALAAMKTPCVWRVEAPAHFVGHMDDKPLEMMLMATSCGKGLGVQLPPPYCAYCGHPIEVQP